MWKGLHSGDVLISIATGELSHADQERTGLVPTHAYALLDLREIGGVQLLRIKNPWNKMRWRGRYSPGDTASWTPELQVCIVRVHYNCRSMCVGAGTAGRHYTCAL